MDYRQQSQQMELRTGGMSVSPQILPDSNHLDAYEQVRLRMLFSCRILPSVVSLLLKSALVRVVQTWCCRWFTAANCSLWEKQANRELSVPVLCVSGCPPVLLVPGEEPPSHVPVVERHLQQVCLFNLQPSGPFNQNLTVKSVTQVTVGLAAPTLKTRSGSECWWWCRHKSWPMGSPTLVTCMPWPMPDVAWPLQETSRRCLVGWNR